MILAVEPRPEQGLEVTSILLSAEDRDYVALLDANAERSDALLYACSWCRRIDVPGEGWIEAETTVRKLDLCEKTAVPKLSHTICPDCEARSALD